MTILPKVLSDISTPMHPLTRSDDARSRAWARAMGLEPDTPAAVRLDRAQAARYSGWFWPGALPERYDACADLKTWFFVEDDHNDEGEHCADPARLEAALGAVHRHVFSTPVAHPSPLAAGLADIHERARAGMSAEWIRRNARHFADHWDAMTQAAALRRYGAGLFGSDTDSFMSLWRDSHAFWCELDFIEVGLGRSLPSALYHHPVFRDMGRLSMNLICSVNDIVSRVKDTAESDPFSMLTHLQRRHGCQPDEAVHMTLSLIEEWTEQFLTLEEQWPNALDLIDVSGQDRELALACAAGLRHAFRGSAEWTVTTSRYRQVDDQ
ncbi:hypothetical protein [Streptomyces sp. SM11]|uniref:terpene synthase family protein n=1 Tax=Streptomyces sp. SM11 TaxID=565557 RepID=UPI0011B036FA|nr:hypothetical protein [Streptomyces sp. SM11]